MIVARRSAHASVAAAAHIMGCDLVTAPAADEHGRFEARTLAQTLDARRAEEIVAVVATAGATKTGAFDDLAAIGDVCARRGLWLHVDGAYGGAALLSPRTRPLLAGIDRADSFIVDPHKMLYTPFDCAAVVCRDSAAARKSLTQTADYLEAVGDAERPNPSDLAVHLTRRCGVCRFGRHSWPTAPTPTRPRSTTAWTSPRTRRGGSPARRCSRRRSRRRSP